MIVTLRGKLTEKLPLQIAVEVAGVGYGIETPMSTFYKLPDVGADVFLYTHLVIREDAHLLFGFATQKEKELFQTLIKVSGIGPKAALAILSGLEPDAFMQCVLNNDVQSLVRVPGVGKKTAERLIIEMRDKIEGLGISGSSELPHVTPASHQSTPVADALSALVALGYKHDQARRAISKYNGNDASSEELIRFALQNI